MDPVDDILCVMTKKKKVKRQCFFFLCYVEFLLFFSPNIGSSRFSSVKIFLEVCM